ncbi:hypothetical protein AB4343_18640, partial [Vibrio breoganii]|uniref:hypothetical protein n=1 Tax=Vibrio breoganii TaxID=553239 RepID=UPI001A7E0958
LLSEIGLKINRMLLFTPRPPSEDTQIQNLTHSKDSVWVFVDPFHRSDKDFVDDNFKKCRLFFFYGVGHRVIESLSFLKILPIIVKDFVEERDISHWYYSSIRSRRKLSRYYSYMLRSIKKRGSKRSISIYRTAYISMMLSNPKATVYDLLCKWNKSICRLYKSIVKGGA